MLIKIVLKPNVHEILSLPYFNKVWGDPTSVLEVYFYRQNNIFEEFSQTLPPANWNPRKKGVFFTEKHIWKGKNSMISLQICETPFFAIFNMQETYREIFWDESSKLQQKLTDVFSYPAVLNTSKIINFVFCFFRNFQSPKLFALIPLVAFIVVFFFLQNCRNAVNGYYWDETCGYFV